MIKNTRQMFRFLIFFLAANNMFCSETDRKILDRVPQQINIPHELHEIKEELAQQANAITVLTYAGKSFDRQHESTRKLIDLLHQAVDAQDKQITELGLQLNQYQDVINAQNQKIEDLEQRQYATHKSTVVSNVVSGGSVNIGGTYIASNGSNINVGSSAITSYNPFAGCFNECSKKSFKRSIKIFYKFLESAKKSALRYKTQISYAGITALILCVLYKIKSVTSFMPSNLTIHNVRVSGNSRVSIGSDDGAFAFLTAAIVTPVLYLLYQTWPSSLD